MPLFTLPTTLPWKWIGIGVLALILVIAVPVFIDRAFDDATDRGRTEERNDQLERTIENVKEAENAREEIEAVGPAGDRARYDQCLRTARTPSNCKRYLPGDEAADR